jgi:hypothetical protein
MLHALADGETDPAAVAALADQRLRATPAELRDALGACAEFNPVYRRLIRLALDDLQLVEQQIGRLDQEIAGLLREHQDAVEPLLIPESLQVRLGSQGFGVSGSFAKCGFAWPFHIPKGRVPHSERLCAK